MGYEDYFTQVLEFFSGLRNSTMEIDGYTTEYLLREMHETIFGITELTNKKEPLALVSYTNADTLGDIGPVAELIQTYRTNEILEKYGLNIKEYMEMPVDIAKLLVSTVRTEKEDINDIVSESERKAKREMKKR